MKLHLTSKKSTRGVRVITVQTKAARNTNITSYTISHKKAKTDLYNYLPFKVINGVKYLDI